MEAGPTAATQSVVQNAGDVDLRPTEHVAKTQRLGERPTRMDTGDQTGSCPEPLASAAASQVKDELVADFELEIRIVPG